MDYFPIKISIMETVGALKKAIKNENLEGFRDVDAKDLILFNHSCSVRIVLLRVFLMLSLFPVWGNICKVCKGCQLFSAQNFLMTNSTLLLVCGTSELSLTSIRTILPISRCGLMPLQYWHWGGDSFEVLRLMKNSVDGLKNVISTIKKDPDDLLADHLKVYKILVDNKQTF